MFMELPISGLQRLFHASPSLSSAQSNRKQFSLESVTEDAHTYDLLFPDLSTLRQAQNHAYPLKNGDPSSAALAANSYDDRGGLNIQSPGDIRIIIAQDGNLLGQQPKILYDSNPPPLSTALRQGDKVEGGQSSDQRSALQGLGLKRHNTGGQEAQPLSRARHGRGLSNGLNTQNQNAEPNSPSSPEVEYRGAFSNPRLRRAGTRPISSGSESLQSRIAREQREETDALLVCMFGSIGFPMVSSTKLHIKPAGLSETNSHITNGPFPTESVSGRLLSRRPTPLTRSTTVEDLYNYPPTLAEDVDQTLLKPKNASILITRLFSVDPMDSNLKQEAETETESLEVKPTGAEALHEPQKRASVGESDKAKQVKAPTYGIAIVLQLPNRTHSYTTLSQTIHTAPSSNQLSQSPNEAENFLWQETSRPNDPSDNFDRNIEIALDYWNIINRVMSSLEAVAETRIQELLVNLEIKYPRQPSRRPADQAGVLGNDKHKKPKQALQKILCLPSNALQQCDVIQEEVDRAGKRVALGLRTQKVVAGQGRWGIWREEARWIAKWAGAKEQNFFFFNLLTAFLGTHTEWLQLLGLRWLRRQHSRQAQRYRNDSVIQQRTVIVSSDKMAARRLVFLLSAFLPSSHIHAVNEELDRPRSPWSIAAYSQSPPSGISVLRQKSLRRTINRRQRGNRSGANSRFHERGVSFSEQEIPHSPCFNGNVNRTALHSRRTSEARLIRSLPLTISPNGDSTRKSSTTTTATVIPDSAIPVPHFSNVSPELLLGTSAEARPGSSGSFASLSLKHTLHRSEGTFRSNASTDSQPMSRWGSMISFWSNRRGSSTDESDIISSSQEGLGISGIPRERRNSRPLGKLAQMVEEVETSPGVESTLRRPSSPTSAPALRDVLVESPDQSTPARNIPERPKFEQFPMKLSVDENDGVIDVDLPMPNSFSSSFASSMSSLKASHTGASSFNDSSLYGRASNQDISTSGSGPSVDVAGWLKNYHPDFVLQAVRPYSELVEEIQKSMRAEHHPSLAPLTQSPSASETLPARPWTDICTTLIADAQHFTVRRLTLRRRPALLPSASKVVTVAPEEEIVSEPIMDLDATLIDAIERVLAQSNQSSRTHSRTHSRTNSLAHSRTVSPSRHDGQHRSHESPFLEVPRSECRKLVLGALEQVARSVGEEQERKERFYRKATEGKTKATDNTLREGVRKWLNGGDGIGVNS